jgi:hypothetical protein
VLYPVSELQRFVADHLATKRTAGASEREAVTA